MLLRIASDLHLEFTKSRKAARSHEWMIPPHDEDENAILVIAGDLWNIDSCERYFPFAEALCERFIKVIYITGNHEYYGSDIQTADQILHEKIANHLPDNFIFLDQSSHIHEDIEFVGTTLWTSMKECDPLTVQSAKQYMPDYRGVIRAGGEDFTPALSAFIHKGMLARLEDMVTEDNGKRKVVITHHCPSFLSVAPRFMCSTANGAFYTSLDPQILDWQPELWVHGHTHDSFDYKIGETRVVCNPHGYPNENSQYPYQEIFFVEI